MDMIQTDIQFRQEASPKFQSAIAAQAIPPTTSLLSYPPLIAIPLEDEKPLRCSYCLRLSVDEEEVITCEKCRCESYCSDTCQSHPLYLVSCTQCVLCIIYSYPDLLLTRRAESMEYLSFSYMPFSPLYIVHLRVQKAARIIGSRRANAPPADRNLFR